MLKSPQGFAWLTFYARRKKMVGFANFFAGYRCPKKPQEAPKEKPGKEKGSVQESFSSPESLMSDVALTARSSGLGRSLRNALAEFGSFLVQYRVRFLCIPSFLK